MYRLCSRRLLHPAKRTLTNSLLRSIPNNYDDDDNNDDDDDDDDDDNNNHNNNNNNNYNYWAGYCWCAGSKARKDLSRVKELDAGRPKNQEVIDALTRKYHLDQRSLRPSTLQSELEIDRKRTIHTT